VWHISKSRGFFSRINIQQVNFNFLHRTSQADIAHHALTKPAHRLPYCGVIIEPGPPPRAIAGAHPEVRGQMCRSRSGAVGRFGSQAAKRAWMLVARYFHALSAKSTLGMSVSPCGSGARARDLSPDERS
jgi:hypothetical protein